MIYQFNLIEKNQSGVVTITDITDYVPLGASVVTKLDDSLDVGQMTIRGYDKSTPFTMFDTIQIKIDGNEVHSLRVAGDGVKLISKNPLVYEHELSLVEHTKVLELYTISGKTFRQPTDGTIEYYLYDVIKILNETTYIDTVVNTSTSKIFTIPTSGDLYDFLTTTISPEYTFNNITLREALAQVCDYIDGIPRLTYEGNELTFTIDFVGELKTIIDSEDTFINKVVEQNITYYTTQLDSAVYNMVSGNPEEIEDIVEYYPNAYQWVTGRTDDYIYDFLKSYIPTPKRIDKIQNLFIKGYLAYTDNILGDIYDATTKYYYDSFTNFPYSNVDDTKEYVDTLTDKIYQWNGSTYVDTGIIVPTIPNISFYANVSAFPSTGNDYIVYMSRETLRGYRWNTTDYTLLNHIDVDGSLLIDASDRTFEYNNYKIKDADGNDRLDPTVFYQTNTLYYNQRKRNIEIGGTGGLFDTRVNIENVIKLKAFELLYDDGIILSNRDYTDGGANIFNIGSNGTAVDNLLYRVGYSAIPEVVRINVERETKDDVYRYSQLISNQQNRIVNFESFANNLQGKINRIGNSELEVDARIFDYTSSDNYVVGDYNDDLYIITTKEEIFFNDYVYVKYGFTRDFNKISSFIAVNSEVRQWEIGEQNTLKRQLKIEEFIECNALESGNGSNNSVLFETDGIKAFMDTLSLSSDYQPVKYGVIEPSLLNEFINCNFSSDGGGNTLSFAFSMKDNYSAGIKRDVSTSQYTNEDVKYVAGDGNFSNVRFYIGGELTPSGYINDYYDNANNFPINLSPVSFNNYLRNDSLYYIAKDTAEELGGTITLKGQSLNKNKFGFGRNFFKRNRLVNENPPTQTKLYYSTTVKMDKSKNFIIPDGFTYSKITDIIPDYTNYKWILDDSDLSSTYTSYIIADENDKILFWVNQDNEILDTITIDFNQYSSLTNYKY